jgi:hypothetical protein
MWWLVYVRWPSGKRETIRTQHPGLVMMEQCVVQAMMPEPVVRWCLDE